MSNSDKAEPQTKNIDKHKSSGSAEPSQDSGTGSRADSGPAPLPNSLPAPPPVSLSPSHSASSIQSETEFSQQKGKYLSLNLTTIHRLFSFGLDNDQPETTGTSPIGTMNHDLQELQDIVKDHYVVEN